MKQNKNLLSSRLTENRMNDQNIQSKPDSAIQEKTNPVLEKKLNKMFDKGKKEEAGQSMLILCCWMFYACSLHLSFLILFALGRIIPIQMVITEPLRSHFFLSISLWKSYQILSKMF